MGAVQSFESRRADAQAWSDVVQRYERYVYAICVRGFRLGHADAEDVFQETFARAWDRLDGLPDEPALRAWLGQVARRLCVDRLRATKRVHPDVDLTDELADPVDAIARIELALDVYGALAQLPDQSREILERFFCEDQSYARISADLGIPAGTIASRISRALAQLRVIAEDAPYGS